MRNLGLLSVKRSLSTSPEPISRRVRAFSGASTIRPVHTRPPPAKMVTKTIALTPPEQLFRKCLLECRNNMQSTPGMQGLVMRWTGGWVRDKLLGVQSHDIDVALSTMTGMQFGEALLSYMSEHGQQYEDEASQQGFKADLKGLHKIAANPEKSKHLETITTRMFGIDVDFVNLRKEVYADDSRNPQMEFGTAEEDALRRDATVNALFYNLDTQGVEDFTGKGLDDMKQHIIRTPLPPYQTFKDDPLRVLRLIRFACRLGYDIEPESQKAMQDKTIHKALRLKISRERVGVEVGKIFSGPDPYTGLKYINDFDLYDTVFADPASNECPDLTEAQAAYDALLHYLSNNDSELNSTNIEQGLAWFLAAYVPWHADAKTAVAAARESIKATNTMSKILEDAIKNRQSIEKAVALVYDNETPRRGQIGMIMRSCKDTWRAQVLYALLCDMTQSDPVDAMGKYQTFLSYLHDQKLENATSIDRKLVLKGNEIKSALGLQKAGPWIKAAVDMVTEWQFDHEDDATKEGAIEMIKSRKSELGID